MTAQQIETYVQEVAEEAPRIKAALEIHYPAINGTCAVCYRWSGEPSGRLDGERWPCPTVRALVPELGSPS